VPKLKHFTLVNQKQYTVLNVSRLETLSANSVVTLESLLEAGILTAQKGGLKLLGDGELTVALTVRAAAATKSAIAKIEAAGGSIEIIG
jgi:large subunit ribosomal protein L15